MSKLSRDEPDWDVNPGAKNDEAFIDESGILLSSIPRASIHAFKRRATDQSCYPY